ncbi:MAG: DUF4340 domain-containing protein [Chloroflexi bacterium]|nr:DUF4340 domain-containing protein [Chloroflexota bacterium]
MNVRLTVGIVIVFLLLGVYVYFGVLRKPANKVEIPPLLYHVEVEKINGVDIRSGDGALYFRKDKDGQWHFDTPEGTPVDSNRWSGIPYLLGGPAISRVITENPDNLGQYGLDPPQSQVIVWTEDGQFVDIVIGSMSPNFRNFYVQKGDLPTVYLIDYTWVDSLTRLLREPPYVTPSPEPTPE